MSFPWTWAYSTRSDWAISSVSLRAHSSDTPLPLGSVKRANSGCVDCRQDLLELHAGAPFVAAGLRLVIGEDVQPIFLGLSTRYEQYLAADVVDAFSVALDVGHWDGLR